MRPQLGALGRLSTGHWVILVAGLVAMVLNFVYLRSQQDTVSVAVASVDIASGTRLDPSMVSFTPVHASADAEEGMVAAEEVERLSGLVAIRSIPSGTLLSERDFAATSTLRAMSIPIDPEHAVGGALRAGDRVDVLVSSDGTARYVLVGAEVLAVSDASGGALGGTGRYAVTVGLDSAAALEVAAALSDGTVDLLRSTGAPAPKVLAFPVDGTQ